MPCSVGTEYKAGATHDSPGGAFERTGSLQKTPGEKRLESPFASGGGGYVCSRSGHKRSRGNRGCSLSWNRCPCKGTMVDRPNFRRPSVSRLTLPGAPASSSLDESGAPCSQAHANWGVEGGGLGGRQKEAAVHRKFCPGSFLQTDAQQQGPVVSGLHGAACGCCCFEGGGQIAEQLSISRVFCLVETHLAWGGGATRGLGLTPGTAPFQAGRPWQRHVIPLCFHFTSSS